MSTQQATTQTKPAAATTSAIRPAFKEADDDLEILLFTAWESEAGKKAKLDQQWLVGWLMGQRVLKQGDGDKKDWDTLLINVTSEAGMGTPREAKAKLPECATPKTDEEYKQFGLRNITEDGEVHLIEPGTIVAATANFKLMSFDGCSVEDMCNDPDHVFKVGIRIDQKMRVKKLANGNTLRMFNKRIYDEVGQKANVSRVKALLDRVKQKQIAELPPALQD